MQPRLVFADRYRLDERLGEGAYGVVHAAFDQGLLQRPVAIKLLRGADGQDAPSAEQTERFIAELQLAGALRHPHIAAVYDAGIWQGQLYMVQELVDGQDLGRFLAAHGPLSVEFVLSLAQQLVDALAYAHEQGIVHRDVKPGNLLIDRDHRVVVVDFGLATSAGPQPAGRSTASGTPGYAAPEQVRGTGDARADQFSLAAVLYLLFTGVAPFVGRNMAETLRRTLLQPPDPPSRWRPELPQGVDRALMRALSKDPADRYPTIRALGAELASHEVVAWLGDPASLRGSLGAAAARGSLVVIGGPCAAWQHRLRLPLVVALEEAGQAEEAPDAQVREVLDPREEIYPSRAEPALLRLADDEALERLREAGEGVRAALVTGCLLVLGLSPEDPRLRRLVGILRAQAPSGKVSVVVAATRFTLEEIRGAERRGLGLLEQAPEALEAELAAEVPPQDQEDRRVIPARPYKFLASFESGDEAIYFGRNLELVRLYARVLARPITLLYGASGSGKTSMIQAALAPRLARAGYRTTITRVFDDPVAEICRAAGVAVDPPEGRAARLGAEARASRLLVLFVDQLEELFLRFPRPVREQIATDLRDALQASEGRLRLVLCLRADYLARLVELREILPLSLECGLYLEPLSSGAMRQAVVGPAALHGVEVEPALLEQMIADLSTDGVDPPQLQLVCDALWDAREPGRLTLAAYRSLGEARDILARHLRSALEGLPRADQEPARALLKAMVTTHDTRSVRRLSEAARGAGLSPEIAAAHLEALARLRLVRPLERDDGLWYELTHEVLAAEIGRWLSEEDRQLSRVRELLEQGLRGYDQLGLLLAPAQLALVEKVAARLTLSDAEQALIARSRAAERRGRRRALLAVAAAALLLAMGVVVGRALWLSQSAFARASEGSLAWVRWGAAESVPTSSITVLRGSADPWFIDAWLGYPRDPYETSWVLSDMAPSFRDALRAGVPISDPQQAEAQLRAQLTPVAAARERFIAGDLEGAADLLRVLADDPEVGPGAALELAPVLALAEPDPQALLGELIEVSQEWAVTLRVPGGGERLEGNVGRPMGLLLLRTPAEVWGPMLDAVMQEPTGPELVGDLLTAAGSPEDVDRLGPALNDLRSANVEGALDGISFAGGCAWIDELRADVASGRGVVARERLLDDYLRLAGQCVSAEDLPVLERLMDDMVSGVQYIEPASEVLRLLYEIDPARVARQMARYEPRLQRLRQMTYSPWGFLADPALVATMTPGSMQQVHARLYLGDPSAVWPAWDFALSNLDDPGSGAWMWPLALYRGQALQDRAIALLQEGKLPIHLRLPLLAVAAVRADDAAAMAVGTGLASKDLVEVQTAMFALSAWPGPLPRLVGGETRQAALGRALIAQRRGEPAPDIFRAALEDPDARFLELVLAMEGQRRLWLEDPAAAADGLRSESARVRLAATLALAMTETLPPLASGGDPWLEEAIRRVRWAHHALGVDRALRARTREALDRGWSLRARQIVRLLRQEHGTADTIESVLSPTLPKVFPAEVGNEAIYLHLLADTALGVGNSTEWMIAYLPRSMAARYGAEPLLASPHDPYLIRVLTGRTPPMTVEDP